MSFRCGYVAFIGRPNVGKSSLMNRLIGESVAIVTPLPQTTRQRITGIETTAEYQMIFHDTPGMHDREGQIHQAMQQWTLSARTDADCVCFLCAADELAEDLETLATCDAKHVHGIVLNKIDTLSSAECDRKIAEIRAVTAAPIFPISARTGDGVKPLHAFLVEQLPEGPALYPDDLYTDHSVRFLVSEIIRKAAMERLSQELPHVVAVEIESYEETPTLHRIHAAIVVERNSQKGIVVGKGGEMVRAIGTSARRAIEALVECQIFLKLHVRVMPKWRRDPKALKQLGLLP
jgi:GTPase